MKSVFWYFSLHNVKLCRRKATRNQEGEKTWSVVSFPSQQQHQQDGLKVRRGRVLPARGAGTHTRLLKAGSQEQTSEQRSTGSHWCQQLLQRRWSPARIGGLGLVCVLQDKPGQKCPVSTEREEEEWGTHSQEPTRGQRPAGGSA